MKFFIKKTTKINSQNFFLNVILLNFKQTLSQDLQNIFQKTERVLITLFQFVATVNIYAITLNKMSETKHSKISNLL